MVSGSTVFFGGLPNLTPVAQIRNYFEETCGKVNIISVDNKYSARSNHKPTLLHRGSGYIEFVETEAALFAASIGTHYLEGNYFEVRLALPKHMKKRMDKNILQEDRKVHLRDIPRKFSICKPPFLTF